jgi:integrase
VRSHSVGRAPARVAKLADAGGLNPPSTHVECGFKSRPGHQPTVVFVANGSVQRKGKVYGLVARNPAAAAKAVSAPRGEQRTWSSDEIQRFFDAVAGERLSMAFVLLAATGMRRGEVLGLRWEDVGLDGRALSIVQTLTTVSNRIHIGPPKTGKSRRRVSLDTVTFEALRAHRMRQLEERLAAGDEWSNDGDLVFTDVLGGPVHPDRFSKSFDRIVRRQ